MKNRYYQRRIICLKVENAFNQGVYMFKTMSQKDLIKAVERAGFVLVRNGEHKVFGKGNVRVMIPHSKTISSGLVHQTFKVLKAA